AGHGACDRSSNGIAVAANADGPMDSQRKSRAWRRWAVRHGCRPRDRLSDAAADEHGLRGGGAVAGRWSTQRELSATGQQSSVSRANPGLRSAPSGLRSLRISRGPLMSSLSGKSGPRYRQMVDASAPYEAIAVTKLTPIIGAEIGGVDLARLADDPA